MSVQNINWENPRVRIYQLKQGDEITILYASRKDKYRVKLGEYIPDTPLMCIKLIKRDKWWQFWKPRYKGGIYQMMTD